MNKLIPKLVAVVLILVVSLLMVVMSTYAWLTMSGSPEVGGVKITVGGLDTILIAPDVSKNTENGVVHYPASFKDKINFSRAEGYEYLCNVVSLSPYSTADGVHWFGSDYTETADDNNTSIGQLVSVDQLPMDDMLLRANLTELPEDGSADGCYVYVDFWVVSPMESCELRVSSGSSGGSFVLDMKDVVAVDTDGDGAVDRCELTNKTSAISSSVRVGFLVNNETVEDKSISEYAASESYSDSFRSLLGIYQEQGEKYNNASKFSIYEPNADTHADKLSYVLTQRGLTSKEYENGSYVETNPIGMVSGAPTTVSVSDIVTVQRKSTWKKAEASEDDLIDQVFQGFYMGKTENLFDCTELFNGFYRDFLQYQYSPYVTSGQFVKNSEDLYKASVNGVVSAEDLGSIACAGATDTVSITTLYRNVPQKIRMYIWIEGQDVDCINSASGNRFTVNLELAGGTE